MDYKEFLTEKFGKKIASEMIYTIENIKAGTHEKTIVCVGGDNGTGKSTLTRLLQDAGVPTAEEYQIFDINMYHEYSYESEEAEIPEGMFDEIEALAEKYGYTAEPCRSGVPYAKYNLFERYKQFDRRSRPIKALISVFRRK